MKQVFVFPRGQLSASDKQEMAAVGIVAVEADDPRQVVQLLPASSLLNGDDLLLAALSGADYSDMSQKAFGAALIKRIRAREAERKEGAA